MGNYIQAMRYRAGQFGLLTLFGAMTITAIACGVMYLPLEQSDKNALLGSMGCVSIYLLARILDKR